MNIKIITQTSAFSELEDEWNQLLKSDLLSNSFMNFHFLYSWWCSYRPDGALKIITVTNKKNRIVGIAPLMLVNKNKHGMNYKCLQFIGDGSSELNHMSFILHKSYIKKAAEALMMTIYQKIDWDILNLNMISKDSLLRTLLRKFSKKHNFRIQTQKIPYAICKFPDSYDAFLRGLQPRFRTKLKSTTRKVNELFDLEFGLHDGENQEKDLQQLFDNHSSRWNIKGQNGAFCHNPRRITFYRELTKRLYRENRMRFFYIKFNGVVVAQQYCFADDRTISLLQEGFNAKYAEYNVGNVLRHYVFKYCFDNDIAVYDFLAYLSRHKLRWSNATEEDDCVVILKRKVKNSIYFYAPLVSKSVKTNIKKVVPVKLLEFRQNLKRRQRRL